MSKSPSLRRIQADIRELALDPSENYHAHPLENDMFEWHFTIRGAEGTDFEGGVYHGRIMLPPEYPFKPPHIIFLTPSGRFETNTKVCLSFSAFHPELWQPAWGIRLILEALISFLPTPADGAIGALDWTSTERKRLAKQSVNFCCATCGKIVDLLPKIDPNCSAAKKKSSSHHYQKEIEKLQAIQFQEHGAKDDSDKKEDSTEEKSKGEEEEDKDTAATTTSTRSAASSLEEQQQQTPKDEVEPSEEKEEKKVEQVPKQQSEPSTTAAAPTTAPTTTAPSTTTATAASTAANALAATTVPATTATPATPATSTPSVVAATSTTTTTSTASTTTSRELQQQAKEPSTASADETATATPAVPQQQQQAQPVVVEQANNNNNNIMSDYMWMLDPLLQLMMVLLAVICYLFIRKFQSLLEELHEL